MSRWFLAAAVLLLLAATVPAEEKRPRVIVLPLGGDAEPRERDRAAFALRTKLDRQGVYEPLDGQTAAELIGTETPNAATSPEEVLRLTVDEAPDVIVWGQYDKNELILKVLHLASSRDRPALYTHPIEHPTDVRFAVEKVVEALPASKPHEHMTEVAVVRDETAERLWRENPNLFQEGTFDAAGAWHGILAGKRWSPPIQADEAGPDGVVIRKSNEDQVLQMKLTRATAETYGLACLSGPIPIEPGTRYRIAFRYRSDGPVVRPFIKGYIQHDGHEREIYRRQTPTLKGTGGKWVDVVDELNPQHQTFPPTSLRVDFYIYLHPGIAEFDDVVIKAVGAQTRHARDEAMDQPVKPVR